MATSPRYVIDTNILVGLARGQPWADNVMNSFGAFSPPAKSYISIVSVAEMESLAIQFGWGSTRVAALRKLLSTFPVQGIDLPGVVDVYATIDAASKHKHPTITYPPGYTTSRTMGKNDLWIAATATVLQAELITSDKDFDHLNGWFLPVHRVTMTP